MQLNHVKNVVGLLPIHQRRTYDESSEVCGRRADLRCPIGAIYRCTLSYISCYAQDILTNLIFPLRRKFSTTYLICYPRRVCEQNKVSSQLHFALQICTRVFCAYHIMLYRPNSEHGLLFCNDFRSILFQCPHCVINPIHRNISRGEESAENLVGKPQKQVLICSVHLAFHMSL